MTLVAVTMAVRVAMSSIAVWPAMGTAGPAGAEIGAPPYPGGALATVTATATVTGAFDGGGAVVGRGVALGRCVGRGVAPAGGTAAGVRGPVGVGTGVGVAVGGGGTVVMSRFGIGWIETNRPSQIIFIGVYFHGVKNFRSWLGVSFVFGRMS